MYVDANYLDYCISEVTRFGQEIRCMINVYTKNINIFIFEYFLENICVGKKRFLIQKDLHYLKYASVQSK